MPKNKKQESSSADSDSGPEDHAPPSKKSKAPEKSGDGGKNTSWVLDKQRHVSINEFKGRKLIDIREYYEKDGKTLPGRKGISLSITQWKNLLEVAKEINEAIGED